MGGGGGGKGGGSPQYVQGPPVTTTTTSNPWAGQQPYLEDIFDVAQGLFREAPAPQFYYGSVAGVPQGQTYAPFSPDTLQAMQMSKNQSLTGTVPGAAQDFSTQMLSGDYLSAGNPYFSNMVDTIRKTVQPEVESQFEKAGRYGSGAMDKAFASAMTDTAGNLAYQNYGDVLKSMGQAAYLAPQTAQLGYLPAQELAQVGGMQEDQVQNAINQSMAYWDYLQNQQWNQLANYANMVSGTYGGTSTTTGTPGQWNQPSMNNTFGNIAGGLGSLGGLGLLAYSMFSDSRTKENIKPIGDGVLETIKRINPVTFDYKPEYGNKNQLGFIADDLEKEVPDLVSRNDEGIRMIAPLGLLPIIIKGMQEQQDQIDQLRN